MRGLKPGFIEADQRDFDSVAGEGGPYLSGVLVEEQLRELDGAVKDIEHYVDRRIAHYNKRGLARPTPTFADLGSTLKTLEKLVILYWQLLKGHGEITMLPTIQNDWKDIFRFPWM